MCECVVSVEYMCGQVCMSVLRVYMCIFCGCDVHVCVTVICMCVSGARVTGTGGLQTCPHVCIRVWGGLHRGMWYCV